MTMTPEERYAFGEMLLRQPPKSDQPGQKFPRGARVRTRDGWTARFVPQCKGEAIVEYTYAQQYWGTNVRDYALVLLDGDGNPCNSVAWFDEDQLTLLDDDTESGIAIIETYHRTRTR